jgi:hypothetical protein
MHIRFKDSVFALAMSTVFDSTEKITILRKRPATASAKIARKAFSNQATVLKEIPLLYYEYNKNMNRVNTGD